MSSYWLEDVSYILKYKFGHMSFKYLELAIDGNQCRIALASSD